MSTFDFRGAEGAAMTPPTRDRLAEIEELLSDPYGSAEIHYKYGQQPIGIEHHVEWLIEEVKRQHGKATPSTRDRAEFEHWWAGLRQRPTDPKELAWLAWHAQATGDY